MDMDRQMSKEEIEKWLRENVVEKIANKVGKKCENVILGISVPENAFFLSSVYFVNIKFDNEDECIRVVIKKPSFLSVPRYVIHTAELFHNEILFYEKVAIESERFPRCLYTFESHAEINDTVIVTENIEDLGFKMCPEPYDIPFEYVIAGVQEIGRFHAMSNVMKSREPERFFKIVGETEEMSFFPGGWQCIYLNRIAKRPILWLRKENYDPKFCDVMEHFMENVFDNVILDAIKPVEPLAVLCHGDFTRNNIFFKKTGAGLESMLIDFAMLRYASAAIDLSTFFYISCSANDRKHRFTEIFRAYYEAFVSYQNEKNIKVEDSHSLDSILADYKRKALFGYVIALFFLPALYGHYLISELDSEIICDAEKMSDVNVVAGGDVMSKYFAEMLLDLRDFGGLDHIPGAGKN